MAKGAPVDVDAQRGGKRGLRRASGESFRAQYKDGGFGRRSSPPGSAGKSLFSNTKLCKFHVAGRCSRGAACTFAHDEDVLKPLPDLYKTKLCPRLCQDPRCTFAHSKEELREVCENRPSGSTGEAAPDDSKVSINMQRLASDSNGGTGESTSSGSPGSPFDDSPDSRGSEAGGVEGNDDWPPHKALGMEPVNEWHPDPSAYQASTDWNEWHSFQEPAIYSCPVTPVMVAYAAPMPYYNAQVLPEFFLPQPPDAQKQAEEQPEAAPAENPEAGDPQLVIKNTFIQVSPSRRSHRRTRTISNHECDSVRHSSFGLDSD